jgi:hypothetical protein
MPDGLSKEEKIAAGIVDSSNTSFVDMPMEQNDEYDKEISFTKRSTLAGDDDAPSNDSTEKDIEKQGDAPPPPPPQEKDPNLIEWDGPNDPQNPMNWPFSKKCRVTGVFASMTFCITFSSSVFSTATEITAQLYGVSNEVMILGTSLFVLVSCPISR